MENEETYSWREVKLPSLIPIVPEPELGRETGQRRRGRDILIAVDHGSYSKHAFDWCLVHLCRLADTIHLIHAVSSVENDVVYDASKELMEKLAVEALQVAMCTTRKCERVLFSPLQVSADNNCSWKRSWRRISYLIQCCSST